MRRWLALLGGLGGLGLFIAGVHAGSARLGGDVGALIEHNRAEDLEVYAYVYTEVGDVSEFLDDEHGRYGAASLAATEAR